MGPEKAAVGQVLSVAIFLATCVSSASCTRPLPEHGSLRLGHPVFWVGNLPRWHPFSSFASAENSINGTIPARERHPVAADAPWHRLSAAGPARRVAALAAKLTVLVPASHIDAPTQLFTDSDTQAMAQGPQGAPEPQAISITGANQVQPEIEIMADSQEFMRGASEYAMSQLAAVAEWVKKHKAVGSRLDNSTLGQHTMTGPQEDFMLGAMDMWRSIFWATMVWDHDHSASSSPEYIRGAFSMRGEIDFAILEWMHEHGLIIDRLASSGAGSRSYTPDFVRGGIDMGRAVQKGINRWERKHDVMDQQIPAAILLKHTRQLKDARKEAEVAKLQKLWMQAAESRAALDAQRQQQQVQRGAHQMQWDPLEFRQMPVLVHPKIKQASGQNSGGFKTTMDEASSAAAMLKTLKRLNQGVTLDSTKAAAASTTVKPKSSGLDDIPPSMLLSDAAAFQAGDFYIFDDRKFRYLHRRPLRPAPLTEVQQLAEDTINAIKGGSNTFLTLPLKLRKQKGGTSSAKA